jgi:membrane dipeptidase
VTAELTRRGYGPREVGLLWSGNFLRVLRAVEREAARG